MGTPAPASPGGHGPVSAQPAAARMAAAAKQGEKQPRDGGGKTQHGAQVPPHPGHLTRPLWRECLRPKEKRRLPCVVVSFAKGSRGGVPGRRDERGPWLVPQWCSGSGLSEEGCGWMVGGPWEAARRSSSQTPLRLGAQGPHKAVLWLARREEDLGVQNPHQLRSPWQTCSRGRGRHGLVSRAAVTPAACLVTRND